MKASRVFFLLVAVQLVGCAVAPPSPSPPPDDAPPTRQAPLPEPTPKPPRKPAPSPEPVAAPTPLQAPTLDADAVLRRFAQGLHGIDCGRVEYAAAGPHQPRALSRMLPDALPLLAYVLEEIQARGLPHQLALLPLHESGYRADPGNRGSFQGLWQFSAPTARRFGLSTGRDYDARYSVVESTDAALRHLDEMWQRWEDWRLVVIGYNAGEFAVQRALRKHPSTRPGGALPPGLPHTSREYVRRIAALSCLLAEPQRHRIRLPEAPIPRLQRTEPAQVTSLADVARASGISEAQLRQWNPQLRHGTPARVAQRPLLLPAFSAAKLTAEPAPLAAPEPLPPVPERWHTVVPGDSLWKIARHYGLRVADLLQWNRLDPKAVLRPGQRLKLEP